MPKVITQDTLIGDVIHRWIVKEYEKHERSQSWYITWGVIAALLVLQGMVSGNFLFSLVIILAGIILYVQSKQDPLDVSFAITALGIIVGNRFYPYGELDGFYIIYEPPQVKMLFIETTSSVRPLLRIPLMDNNPIEIRATLRKHLDEDLAKEAEPVADTFARRWRIH